MPSRRDRIRMSPAEIDEFLDQNFLAVLGTQSTDGTPHLSTVGFLRAGDDLLVTAYATSQKIRNLERNPLGSVLVEIPAPYAEIRGVLIRGRFTVQDDPGLVSDIARRIYAKSISSGETQQIEQDRIAPKRRVLRLPIAAPITWDHRKLDGAY